MNYICILTHGDDPQPVLNLLRSIQATVRSPHTFNVLAQAVSDDCWAAIQEELQGWGGVWRSDQNLHAIGGRLRLIDRVYKDLSMFDYVTFLDDDVVCTLPGWDNLMIAAAAKYGMASQVSVDIRADWTDFEEPPDLTVHPGEYDVCGGGMTTVKASYLQAGCEYDQSFLPFWHADADFSLQVRSKGGRIWGCDAGLQHDHKHRNHDFFWKRNFNLMRRKWQGKGLIKAERDKMEA